MWCHTVPVSSLGQGLLAFGDQLPTNKESIERSASNTPRWKENKGSNGLFLSTFRVSGYSSVNMLADCLFLNWREFCWMKGDQVCSFGVFDAEFVFFHWRMKGSSYSQNRSERIAWPLRDWPAGTLDMSSHFEDKSCRTVSLETRGQTARKLFQKVKSGKAFLKPKKSSVL